MHKLLPIVLSALMLWGCGSGSERPSHPRTPQGSTGLYAAQPDSPYANVLPECAFVFVRGGNNNANRACTMNRLPLLGQDHETIEVEHIMSRTVISHDWMGVRFEQLLEELPDDLLQLFQAVTAVVIGADIRPSYYWTATGAIYLDPSRLWLTEAEKNTISRAPDFRSEFGQELDFTVLWRYVKDDTNAWRHYSLSGPETQRPLSHIVYPMASLLFHELAHANDYIPPTEIPHIDRRRTVLQAAIALESNNISAQLRNAMPLRSEMLFGLADVMYLGDSATAAQRALSAEQVGLEFADDIASDTYSYSTSAEDTAMLFEEAMMRYHFGIERDLAFTDAPDSRQALCNDYVVRWGSRGRVGDPDVRERVALILPLFLDRNDVSEYLDALDAPTHLAEGRGWCETLSQPAFSPALLKAQPVNPPLPEQEQEQEHRHTPGHPHH
ncbi:hypothetical protein [Marinimicrobium sp. ABcell2]|uniref:hypothetical protein n=1 Tax=Marinimicrobium sp. ABcell2 TaxID=3069751 RepID=UPI0027B42326|nr:hypothetical protein [Marinimicrobium sp. ABcell2]MDQ2078279.1 hypothetical protein [Marinimicrobium sp. ABcell2]